MRSSQRYSGLGTTSFWSEMKTCYRIQASVEKIKAICAQPDAPTLPRRPQQNAWRERRDQIIKLVGYFLTGE
jgi:hypothetical protein